MTSRRAFLFAAPFAAIPLPAQKTISDDEIYDRVRQRLANDPDIKGAAFEIEVKAGVVTIKGSVDREKWKLKTDKVAKKVKGVREVRNLLVVKPGGIG
jgi:osmotically-inducible protein OsmY